LRAYAERISEEFKHKKDSALSGTDEKKTAAFAAVPDTCCILDKGKQEPMRVQPVTEAHFLL
jgi:hypothetical protein